MTSGGYKGKIGSDLYIGDEIKRTNVAKARPPLCRKFGSTVMSSKTVNPSFFSLLLLMDSNFGPPMLYAEK